MFTTYKTSEALMIDGNIYLLQYASYISRDVMEENVKRLDNYLVTEEDNKFYVYIGAFINMDNAYKMQKYFENNNIYTYIKNDFLDSSIIEKIKKEEDKIDENDKNLSKVNNEIINILKKI